MDDDTPVCPGCGAVGIRIEHELMPNLIPGLKAWHFVTEHEPGCTWMADPNAEPYD